MLFLLEVFSTFTTIQGNFLLVSSSIYRKIEPTIWFQYVKLSDWIVLVECLYVNITEKFIYCGCSIFRSLWWLENLNIFCGGMCWVATFCSIKLSPQFSSSNSCHNWRLNCNWTHCWISHHLIATLWCCLQYSFYISPKSLPFYYA
jgi:hypothetical protein